MLHYIYIGIIAYAIIGSIVAIGWNCFVEYTGDSTDKRKYTFYTVKDIVLMVLFWFPLLVITSTHLLLVLIFKRILRRR